MANFSSIAHLFGRFPDLNDNFELKQWLAEHPSRIWHETALDLAGEFSVIIQAVDNLNIFGILMHRKTANESWSNLVKKTLPVILSDSNTKSYALDLVLSEKKISDVQIFAARPRISFDVLEGKVEWEIEIVKNENNIFQYLVHGERILSLELVGKKRNVGELFPLQSDDTLATNEIHHPSAWSAIASQWTVGASDVLSKALRIWLNTKSKMHYDGTIIGINDYTWSDNYIINSFGWRGVCDEWAVIQVTMLRAVGIPACLKWISFHYNGEDTAHACVEFLCNGTWRHMDALWNSFQNPSVYRQKGASWVNVMDVSLPRNTGIGRCDCYNDFIVSPAFPGNSRPGYSFDKSLVMKEAQAKKTMMEKAQAMSDPTQLNITDQGFMFCQLGASCNINDPNWEENFEFWRSILQYKDSIGFYVETQASADLVGHTMSVTVFIQDMNTGEQYYQDTFENKIDFAYQKLVVYYAKMPSQLKKLPAVKYKYYVVVFEEVIGVFADSTTTMYVRDMPPKDL